LSAKPTFREQLKTAKEKVARMDRLERENAQLRADNEELVTEVERLRGEPECDAEANDIRDLQREFMASARIILAERTFSTIYQRAHLKLHPRAAR
jgi:cell division protein FtsB